MKSLTIVFVTSRPEPELDWFFDSLEPQINSWEHIEVIVVHSVEPHPGWRFNPEFFKNQSKLKDIRIVKPKPTLWQGEHRITKEDWWAVSNARNTGICLCKTEWIAFLDDRCVLAPTWLQAIRNAMEGNYAVCGTYEKRHGMTVENGVIRNGGIVTGRDNRDNGREPFARTVDGGHWYGCTNALPLEWALTINGYEELMDGLSFEDVMFGKMLQNNAYPIKFDPTMRITEDRSPDKLGPTMKRSDKGKSPNDKSHAALARFGKARRSDNFGKDLRNVREGALRGESWEIPDLHFEWRDWYDGQPLREL